MKERPAHITIRSNTKLGVLTSTCSVVCLFPQAYFNKFSVAALEAPLFHPLLCLAAQRKGMAIIMNDVVCISRSKEKEILSLIKQDGDTFCVIINGKIFVHYLII